MSSYNSQAKSPSPCLPALLFSTTLDYHKSTSDSSEPDTPKKAGKWTSEEDDLLRKYVSTYSEKQWKKISEHIPGRTPIQCLHRWTKILKPGLVKGPWTHEEDEKLLGWITKHGPGKWAQAAGMIPGRSGKQCRERWFNNLNPDVKKGNWSTEEDQLIFDLYQKHGSSWSKISKYIPGRTENSIKNRFYSTLRKLAASKSKENTGSTGSDVRSNGSTQEEILVKQEDGTVKDVTDTLPLLARNSNVKQESAEKKAENKIEKPAANKEALLPDSLSEQQKALHSLLLLLQVQNVQNAQNGLTIPQQLPLLQAKPLMPRVNDEVKQLPVGRDLLSAPLAFSNRNTTDLLLPMLRELNKQNKPQFPVQSQDYLSHLIKPQLSNVYNEAGGLDALIKSISSDIATASLVYSHHLESINEMVKNMNRDSSEEAKERLNALFRQVYALEAWLSNAKGELARLESLVHAQRYLAQLPLDMSLLNKRKFIGDENVQDQLIKKRKVE